ncbi:winged helix-turn-helix domain-containing protein [Streptomyces marispadix]|uniref:Helix-turn-helix domain-containing protein n=1 Tax=Streptomyces marispadix TaxID=2922868 RepID=A0ABS9ST15_9ACTN|nr:helix-turn-helix domain-containing protein [Streptomyces marispadix]MCH6159438.1 helix-turn-helix domain-containing protein [Streptomyces marispadix]
MTGMDRGAERDAVVLDAKGLRALAHPVRVQLVGLLRKHGPSTATRLAERLGVNSGTASYHLRQLDAAGFVEEDAERGNARERWWRSVHRSTRFDDIDLAEQEPEATLTYLHSVAAAYTLRAQRAVNEYHTLPRAWRAVADMSDWALRLTPAESRSLYEELAEVIGRYRRDSPGTPAPDGAERVMLVTQLFPELDTAPEGPEDTAPAGLAERIPDGPDAAPAGPE